jgi:BlaI family penicillinase repressor
MLLTMTRTTGKPASHPPLPSDAELDILASIWTLGPSTVREVHDALRKTRGYTTTLKQMQVMASKGLLERSERFRSHVYEAAEPKEDTQARIAADLLKRAFDNSTTSLVLGMLSARPASAGDLAEIRQLLRDFEKRQGRP